MVRSCSATWLHATCVHGCVHVLFWRLLNSSQHESVGRIMCASQNLVKVDTRSEVTPSPPPSPPRPRCLSRDAPSLIQSTSLTCHPRSKPGLHASTSGHKTSPPHHMNQCQIFSMSTQIPDGTVHSGRLQGRNAVRALHLVSKLTVGFPFVHSLVWLRTCAFSRSTPCVTCLDFTFGSGSKENI